MSNDKTNATFHPGTAPVYLGPRDGWATPPPPVNPGREFLFGDSPEPERKPSRSMPLMVLGLSIVVLALAGFAVQRADILPVWVPILGKDSGVAACEAIAAQPDGKLDRPGGVSEEFGGARKIFADSRYPAIRDNGVRVVDLATQMDSIAKGEEKAAIFALVGPFTQAYAGLAGGCAEQGHTIPALGS